MNNLNIIESKSTPKIDFNIETHIHYITGESYPENSSNFYEPILEWIENYLEYIDNQKVIFNIELIYFNSSSSRVLMDIFDMLDEACGDGKTIIVNWFYDEEDEALEEYGEEFAEDMEYLTFNIEEKS